VQLCCGESAIEQWRACGVVCSVWIGLFALWWLLLCGCWFASVVAIMADDKRLQSLKLLFSTLDSDNKGVISITTFKDVCIVR
jgi:hypothetical protein